MSSAVIEQFYATHQAIYSYLLDKSEITFASESHNNFRRTLILAIASYFESEIVAIVRELPQRFAGSHPFITELLEQKAINRQYHTYFDWEKSNANKFFGMFGSEFSEAAKKRVREEKELEDAIKSFLNLGNTRNRLIHLNYVTFDIDKTPDEIIVMFRSALKFVAFLRKDLLGESPLVVDAAAAAERGA